MEEQITHISIKIGSGYNLVPLNDWLKKPVPERVQIILHNKAQFLNNDQPKLSDFCRRIASISFPIATYDFLQRTQKVRLWKS